MSLINSTAIPSGASAYEIDQSLRFEDGDSPYLSWTPASAGNRKTWTYSVWVKRGNLTSSTQKISGAFNGTNEDSFNFNSDKFTFYVAGANSYGYQTANIYRDLSAWYHFVVAVDTTQGTAADRVKLYVNGVATTFGAKSGLAVVPQNYEFWINGAFVQGIGWDGNNTTYLDGYLAEYNFIDGAAKVPADFGEFGDYGEWKPIRYSGSYGTNGFYLSFAGGGIMSATGGNSTATDGDFKAASFTANGTFTPSADGYVEYLVIGGGGGGGNRASIRAAGGGGAGGYRTGMLPVTAGTGYSITVGSGGARSAGTSTNGSVGSSSVFSSITSLGGGNGSGGTLPTVGGSGGGGASGGTTTGGSGTAGQGFDGGTGGTRDSDTTFPGGGGGGAGAVGQDSQSNAGGNGGAGLASSITGSAVTRAGGGGGGNTAATNSSGGSGGGGTGGGTGAGSSGTANTGSGGGGSGTSVNGGAGGSGIVIIRYKFQ